MNYFDHLSDLAYGKVDQLLHWGHNTINPNMFIYRYIIDAEA